MKRPSWATVVGVLAIIFGAFGILGGAQEIGMPKLLESQQAMMAELSKQSEMEGNEQIRPPGFDSNTLEVMQESFKVPEWYKAWAAPMGVVSILIAAAYFYFGIALLTLKEFAIKLAYYALGASIGWTFLQIMVFSASGSLMLMAQSTGNIFSIVVDVILGAVVFFGTKEAYRPKESAAEI